jgi:hypothetical protein
LEDNIEKSSIELAGNSSSGVVREFIVEVLGCLVPGVAFLVVLVPALILPADRMLRSIFPGYAPVIPVLEGEVPLSIGTVLFLLVPGILAFLAFAYISGHLFFRHTPKTPDKKSYSRMPENDQNEGMCRITEDGKRPVEFPYHFLKDYLRDRGIGYLADLIPWPEENEPRAFRKRAKHFANALKIRIRTSFPDHYYVLARNEAHVRLSSSMWYVCHVLVRIAIAMSAIEVIILIAGLLTQRESLVQSASLGVLPVLAGIVSYLVKVAIERVLHYQREREVLFILETAYWLMHTGKAPHIFDGLDGSDNTQGD